MSRLLSRLLPEPRTGQGPRHRSLTRAHQGVRDIAAQRLGGHASPATTRRSMAVGDDAMWAAARATA